MVARRLCRTQTTAFDLFHDVTFERGLKSSVGSWQLEYTAPLPPMTKQPPQRAVENDARMGIRTKHGFPHVLGKASHKTLRLSPIYHSPDGSLLAPRGH